MELLREELSSYSNELIILGVVIIAFVSLYSRYFNNKKKK